MGYRENVQALCDKLGIMNPIQEKDILVTGISFEIDGRWKCFGETDMNRDGRLFFHHQFWSLRSNHSEFQIFGIYNLPESLMIAGREFFAENWDDAEEASRPMIMAFKRATSIQVNWK